MAEHDTQFIKGILSMLLLGLLAETEDYGYSAVVRLQDFGFAELKEGTVYPALTRLEKKGLLESRLVPSDAGPARKYYRPTTSGLSELKDQRRSWEDLVHHVNTTLDGHPTDRTQPTPSEKKEKP